MGFAEGRFAEWMRSARTAQDLSQADLATALKRHGISAHATTIAKIEAGDRSVKLDEAVAICSVLGGSLGELFPLSDPHEPSRRLDALEREMLAFGGTVLAAGRGLDDVAQMVLGPLPVGHCDSPDEERLRDLSYVAVMEAWQISEKAGDLYKQMGDALEVFNLSDSDLRARYRRWMESDDADT